jgi:hypothetical protein
VYPHIDSASSRKLGVAFNACLRYVHGIGRRESVAHLQTSINGLGLEASATLQHFAASGLVVFMIMLSNFSGDTKNCFHNNYCSAFKIF